jgi:hypothetical protein
MFKGQHLLQTDAGKQYVLTLHDPAEGHGHCGCPDYAGNRLGTCKHLIYLKALLRRKREIERFSDEKAEIIEGGPMQRQAIYGGNGSYFKITNYEAVLRDVMLLAPFEPDLVILDEAQRTQNFSTKTADAVKSIPRRHAVVLTGTPLENRLEDVYSIVQFLDPQLLSPLWRFAAEHFAIPLT